MHTTDFIRAILDLIDSLDKEGIPDDSEHLSQVTSLITPHDQPHYNSCPDEKYGSIDDVTTNAGGGLNGPKAPEDIRVKDPRGYE